MRKLTDQERQLLRFVSEAGGSYCPGADTTARIPRDGHKSLKRMAKDGFLTIEDTDDGPRFTLTSQGQEEANG
ncbi:MAG: hypothetical protein ABW043_12355 [Devosia sp.]|uniref:hypothetical protein n=1 Tax=Devosia sp. TaxID=1871048 RepID=UPI0033925326